LFGSNSLFIQRTIKRIQLILKHLKDMFRTQREQQQDQRDHQIQISELQKR